MTRDEQIDHLTEFLGEGFHTAFRKAVPDSDEANQIWHLIKEMKGEDWTRVLAFVAEPLLDALPELVGEVRSVWPRGDGAK